MPCVLHVLITQKLTRRTFNTLSTRVSRHDSEELLKFTLCDASFCQIHVPNHIIVHVNKETSSRVKTIYCSLYKYVLTDNMFELSESRGKRYQLNHE